MGRRTNVLVAAALLDGKEKSEQEQARNFVVIREGFFLFSIVGHHSESGVEKARRSSSLLCDVLGWVLGQVVALHLRAPKTRRDSMVFHSFLEASALLNPWVRPRPGLTSPPARREAAYRSLLASRSDSRRVRISPSLTGPLTLRMMRRFWSSRNLTRTWVTCPRDPVLPMTLTTIASFRGDSCGCDASRKKKEYESLRQRAGSSEKKVAQGAQSEAARGKQVRRPQRRSASRIARARCRHGTVWSFPSLCPTPDPQDLGGLEDGERKNRWVPRLPLEAIAPRSAASSAILASHYVHLTPPSGEQGSLPWLQ